MVTGAQILNNPDVLTTAIPQAGINFGSTLYLVLWISLVLLVLGGFGFFIWWRLSFRETVKIKEIIGGETNFLILSDMAKRKKEGNAEFWKLRRRKALIPAPPSEALQITSRGRFYAECVHNEKSGLDAGYEWIIPSNDNSGSYTIQQTQEERALLADRLRRAQERKSRSMLDIVMQFAGMMFVLIIVISLMAFYGEIASSLADANKEQQIAFQRIEQITDKQTAFQDSLNELFGELTCVPTKGGALDLPLDQTVKGG